MIRINLLNEGRRPVVAKMSRGGDGGGIGLGNIDTGSALLVGLVIIGLLVSLGHNFLLGSKIEAREVDLAEAQAEVERLAPIIQEVEEFKAKRADLEHKVNVISALKANQKGPVRIMDKISRALPELLWLQRMEVVANNVTIEGRAFNTNAVANFIENLDKVPEFQEPILQDTAQQQEFYTFKVTFSFTNTPTTDEAATAAAEG